MVNSHFNFNCGNSSAVEHDLAKVGVASSNLVSRSILLFTFLLIFSIPTFAKNTNLSNQKNSIIEALELKFEEKYPCIIIDSLDISTTTSLPKNFKSYRLKKIDIKNAYFRKRKGSFKAIFQNDTKEKAIYLKFFIDAQIEVFKAKRKLYNDTILLKNDYQRVEIKLDKLPSKVITCSMIPSLITKNYVQADSILTMNRFKHKKDLLRGDHIKAHIVDGMLVLVVEATLLSNANIGEVVKIKTDNGRLFKAKIVSKNEAIILE